MEPANGHSDIPPPPADVWGASEGMGVHYLVNAPWQWVMRKVKTEAMAEVEDVADLPSVKAAKEAAASLDNTLTPSTRSRRRQRKDKVNGPSTLKIEVSNPKTGNVAFAAHGTSSALDGIEDKDELVRTLQRCRCDHLNLSPPSILINWDVSREECLNVIGKDLPKLERNNSEVVYAVLKEPMGSKGQGIYFVKDADEIHNVITEHRQHAQEDPAFLDNLIEAKGRIPSWGELILPK